LLSFSFARTDGRMRRKLVDKILAQKDIIGIIECFQKGGIIHKPIEPFDFIAVSRAY